MVQFKEVQHTLAAKQINCSISVPWEPEESCENVVIFQKNTVAEDRLSK